MKFSNLIIVSVLLCVFMLIGSCCSTKSDQPYLQISANVLDFSANTDSPFDRSSLAFSDQGAWFAYGFPDNDITYVGFAGPFIMTQENGVWSSNSFMKLNIVDKETNKDIKWSTDRNSQKSYLSHLEQVFINEKLYINQQLVFISPHTAMIVTEITNDSKEEITILPTWSGELFPIGIKLVREDGFIKMISEKSDAIGIIDVDENTMKSCVLLNDSYSIELSEVILAPGTSKEFVITQTFIFPENNWDKELSLINEGSKNPVDFISSRVEDKLAQLTSMSECFDSVFTELAYSNLLVKCMMTMQNNWRTPAGELKHSGLFPSYHYEWFNGMWAWDSWKHAVALAQYDKKLAEDQIRSMYDYMDDQGFIADCIYRDTTIENHNYRNTKPPLSGWAIWNVFEKSGDTAFLKEMYPKLLLQHGWWYINRDHDKDSLCEYGSTDGTLIAAKWESGMDNAVRFDNSKLLKNSEFAYSLDQESVDLNSYLYDEKCYISLIANVLGKDNDAEKYMVDSKQLKQKIRSQFYCSESGWFYDTSIDGSEFINVMGCEGWLPLWAQVATDDQAAKVVLNIMDSTRFNTKVPLQTLSADHPKFKPDGGYWRGPTWLDQAYFGVVGLRNYNYNTEADLLTKKLMHNAEGVMDMGKSIRENYNPITGEGLESENFSWSAAHYLLLLKNR